MPAIVTAAGLDGLEPEHRPAPSLDRSVILLDDVVEILARSNMHAPPCGMLSAKQPESTMARPVAIEGHLLRRTVRMRGEGLPEEGLRGSDAAVLAQEEVDRAALLIDRSI